MNSPEIKGLAHSMYETCTQVRPSWSQLGDVMSAPANGRTAGKRAENGWTPSPDEAVAASRLGPWAPAHLNALCAELS